MSRLQRWVLVSVATWPRQLVLIAACGVGFAAVLDGVFNAAEWLVLLSCGALGYAIGAAMPEPDQVRNRLGEGAPHGRGE